MIIDSHAHLGKILNFDMRLKTLLESMKKYEIDFSLVSPVQAGEFDHNQKLIPLDSQVSQYEANKDIIDIVKKHPDKLGALLWAKPNLESCDDDFEDLIRENREFVYGLKFHPYHSNLPFNDPKYEPYFLLAKKYDLTVVTHTAGSY